VKLSSDKLFSNDWLSNMLSPAFNESNNASLLNINESMSEKLEEARS